MRISHHPCLLYKIDYVVRLCRGDLRGKDAHPALVFPEMGILDNARNLGKQREILALSHVFAGEKLVPALAHYDASTRDQLALKDLAAQMLPAAVATVPAASNTFLMCHD